MRLWESSSCAAQRFKAIVYRFFGHLESNHQLITPAETAKQQFGIEVGQQVAFSHRGQALEGIVNRIQRRVTVLVPDPKGTLCRPATLCALLCSRATPNASLSLSDCPNRHEGFFTFFSIPVSLALANVLKFAPVLESSFGCHASRAEAVNFCGECL